MQTEPAALNSDEAIDLPQLAATMWAGRWWIIVTTFLCSAAAVAYAMLAPPVFRAEALVQLRQQESRAGGAFGMLTAQLGGLPDFADFGGSAGGDRALAMATLRSRVVIQAFIRDKNLLPELFADSWDPANKRWRSDDPKKEPTLWHGYETFSKDILKVSEDKKTGLVTVAIEWRDPEVAASWVTELLARTNVYLRDSAIRESEENLNYLREEAKKTSLVELQQAVYMLMEGELKKLMIARSSEEYAIKVIDPAQAPKLRTKPKRRQIAIVGLLFGAFFGVAAVFVRNAFRRRVV